MNPKYKNVLVLAAHPDDETLGAGATIKKLHDNGSNIQLIVFTDGVSARSKRNNTESRTQVLSRVSELLGIASYDVGDFPDNKMDTIATLDICKFIENKTPFEPDLILTHDISCLNVDHKKVNEATLTVFRPQWGKKQTILSYFIPSSTDYNFNSKFEGRVYIDVEDTYENKLNCLSEVYPGELRPAPHSRSLENIEMLMRVWGAEVGLRYTEKFNLLMQISDL